MKVIELRFTPFRLHFTAWLLAGTVGEHRFQNGHEREAICGVAAKKKRKRGYKAGRSCWSKDNRITFKIANVNS